MTRLAQAVRAASDDALLKVSLESLATEMSAEEVSLEHHVEDITAMASMAHSLDNVVVTFESFAEPTAVQKNFARDQALSILSISGLKANEVENIFPSLEADGDGWEKFKDFLKRMWDYILAAAKKIYEFIEKVLKRSSLAERAAMSKLRSLRSSVAKVRNGVTINAQIQLRPAHRYLFDNQGKVDGFAGLRRNVDGFLEARDAVQGKLPKLIEKVANDMVAAVDKLALNGNDAQVSASILSNKASLRAAAMPMFPEALARALGFRTRVIPLAFDRVVSINKPINSADAQITDEEVSSQITQFGITIDQVEVPVNLDQLGTFPALRMNEIDELLKLAERLIDTGHSADQQRQWQVLKHAVSDLSYSVNSVVKTVLKKQGLDPAARQQLRTVLNASRAVDKWIAAPFMQLNTINVRVVDSILAMVEDQAKNYELVDSMQERVDKAAQARKDEKKSDKK